MVKIKEAKPAAPYRRRTVKFGQAVEKGKNVFYQGGRTVQRAKASVRRLMVVSPANPDPNFGASASVNTRPEVDQFTNNPNPSYDPSRAPGGVQVKDSSPQPPKGATSGHAKVIRQNNQMRTGGKRLRRRP